MRNRGKINSKVVWYMNKKKRRKEEREKRESGCLIFEHEIEAFRGVFFERKSWNKSPYLDSPLNSERFDI